MRGWCCRYRPRRSRVVIAVVPLGHHRAYMVNEVADLDTSSRGLPYNTAPEPSPYSLKGGRGVGAATIILAAPDRYAVLPRAHQDTDKRGKTIKEPDRYAVLLGAHQDTSKRGGNHKRSELSGFIGERGHHQQWRVRGGGSVVVAHEPTVTCLSRLIEEEGKRTAAAAKER
ncbi:hypothetical protein OsI_14446 [Oryza sativa Indica Group]|uniref:Uncharacterized protein n=1 Tax=Oryza sativa subsp. indica TaxID=39946 RepID=B8AP71_ORYSI|nr:hypothetical protein OsI_14446 [Oryza sativa Indica Group]